MVWDFDVSAERLAGLGRFGTVPWRSDQLASGRFGVNIQNTLDKTKTNQP